MSALVDIQAQFLDQLLDEKADRPSGWSERAEAGMQVYRGNYRSALVDAIRDLYEKTEKLLGEEAFRPLAIHHAIAHPPTGWTIDEAGEGFANTLAQLVPDQHEAAALATLEWAMHRATIAADAIPLSMEDWAALTASFAPEDWATFSLRFVPALSVHESAFDAPAMFAALSHGDAADPVARHGHVAIWREDEVPVAQFLEPVDGAALTLAITGASFGDIVGLLAQHMDEATAAQHAGALLGQWLGEGWITEVRR